ncbi:MAG: hypothetical protein AAFV95_09545 [Bacteroidota bacterium]
MSKQFIVQTTLALLLIGSLSPLSAQPSDIPADVYWGKELREPGSSTIRKIIDVNKKGFYVLREKDQTGLTASNTQKIFLESYDNNMKLKKSNEIALKYKNKNLDLEDVLMVGGKIYLLSSYHNQAKKKNYLFTQEISRRNLQLRKTMTKIGEIDTRNKVQEGYFDNHISRDSSKILIYNELPYKKKEPERFALRVFDNQFNEIWSRNITLPYNDEIFNVEEYRVDNQGNVYLLGVVYSDRSRTRRKGKPTYQYTILAYTQDGAEAEEYRIKLEDKFITDLTFRVANDGNLVCSGFYSDIGTYSIKGTYFLRLNANTKQVITKNLKQFDFDFLTANLSDRKKAKVKDAEARGKNTRQAELYQYSLDHLILRSDGGALLVAEQYFVQEESFRDFYYGRFTVNYFYNYNDIIVVNIRPDGEIEWATHIPKRQETSNDGGYFSSYAMSIVRDRLYFIFNDNGRNFSANDRRLYNFDGQRNSVISLAEVRKDGSLDVYPLFNNREADIITRPKVCKQSGKREMVIYGERGRKYKFAKLVFKG